nr:MAG TPA: hypothetical protein [Caudoviricetes sp.]
MISISFPIAHHPSFRNPPTYVYLITLLLPEDDTPDVIPRHTYLRHAYHVSATRNFRHNPKEVSGLSSLASSSFVCIHASMCSASRAGETSARATQEHAREAAKRMSTPRSITPPRPIPTHLFHVKHARTIIRSAQERERIRHAPGLSRRCAPPLRSLRSLRRRTRIVDHGACRLPALRTGFSTHVFHVKHARKEGTIPAPGRVVPAQ